MLKIDVSPESEAFILSLPPKRQKQIVNKIDALAEGSEAGIKPLKEFPSFFRLRSGDYRIVYFVDGDVLNIVLIDLRNRIYKQLGRKFK